MRVSDAPSGPRRSATCCLRSRRLALAITVFITVATACAPSNTPKPSNGPSSGPPATVSAPSAPRDAFVVSADEAASISTVVRFIESINAGDIDAATTLVSEDANVSDCDYIHRAVREFKGKPSVVQWLVARIADHERLSIGSIFNANDVFDRAVGVDFANRSNDTLARLGSPGGLVPSMVAKVVVTQDLAHIGAFAFGPGGADPGTISSACQAG
jgi:hypothetical protein